MKKISTICIATFIICTCSFKSNAALIFINVEDFEFNPEIFTINVGDQVMWEWDNSAGAHTTTSTVIPAGAASWDQLINQTSQTFTYTATIPGSYDYVCTLHASMGMVGHFTVLGSTGIAAIPTVPALSINGSTIKNGELIINYSIPATSKLNLQIYDMLGKSVRTFEFSNKSAGSYSETYTVADLKKGIYIVQLKTAQASLTRKIIIQ